MFPTRVVQLIEANADGLADGVMCKIKNSVECESLLRAVPEEELKRRAHEIYRHLADWLSTKTESEVEERYVGIGVKRARQGIPFSNYLWAITATKEHLWDYLQREGVLEEPVELWGNRELLHTLDRFFDSALYYAAVGYESVSDQAGRFASSGSEQKLRHSA
jgi:hypothetical protein